MKTLVSLLLATFLTFFATGAAWTADDHDHHSRSKLYGTVEEVPEDLYGRWIVNGRLITVTPQTRIVQEYGMATVGAFVEVKGEYDGREFLAEEIEIKQGIRPAVQSATSGRAGIEKFYGTITSLPRGDLGTWIIDGREVFVDDRTRIDEKHGEAVVGSPVEIKGTFRGESFHALKIEVKRNR